MKIIKWLMSSLDALCEYLRPELDPKVLEERKKEMAETRWDVNARRFRRDKDEKD